MRKKTSHNIFSQAFAVTIETNDEGDEDNNDSDEDADDDDDGDIGC